ncbi:metallophosphoesterase family protein [Paenibacillus sp. LHD-117]|uniref:metallophosphoesterase family protein n=1 Tax=Paenibacillus sp. LHD-117 TaxID=3071412 RepID=UPI0027E1BFBB|nr:metallophosphoesterase family protein [Paenibacillus sp. LHD-117]MDQ6421344.1 metallophosphoesterase family protein [Paenibacillus sp. LHD-117]
MDKQLKFNEDGTFTIVQFTDLHWQNGDEKDELTRALMEEVIREEKPDLIVFTGDLIYSEHCENPERSVREVVAEAVRSGVPWAAVLGNHDAEANVTREEVLGYLRSQQGSLTGHTPGVRGFGNYALQVAGSGGTPAAALYFLDSGDYSKLKHVDSYAWINRDQIDWYAAESRQFAEKNGGETLPALTFFHIPLPEYETVWAKGTCFGQKHENVCSAKINSGLFAAMVERSDVMGTFVGHDHINDFWGELYGIRLTYGRASGYNTYGKEGFPRGARVIRLREGERQFESWLRLADGSVDRQEAKQEAELKQ